EVEELDAGRAQRLRRILRLDTAGCLDLLQCHSALLPQLGAFTALTVGQANNGDVIALLGVQCYGTTAAPDEIGGMRADDQRSLVRHLSVSKDSGRFAQRMCGRERRLRSFCRSNRDD